MRGLFLELLYGGQLFLGLAGLFVGICVVDMSGMLERSTLAKRTAGLLALFAGLMALVCAPPAPLAMALTAVLSGALYLFLGLGRSKRVRYTLGGAATLATVVVAGNELRYFLAPAEVPSPSRLTVLGDSLSAGGFGERTTWPDALGETIGVETTNLALASATAADALEHEVPLIPRLKGEGECVLVAIGGNGMLSGVDTALFESALDGVLEAASGGGKRQVVVLEVPLLPGRWSYGRILRRAARKHKCTLVPKRVLAAVLTRDGNTYDGIHLTDQGHGDLADRLVRALRWN